MRLPEPLVFALDQLAQHTPLPEIREAYRKLSASYHEGENSLAFFREPAYVLAYLLARMPATYAATLAALNSLKERLGDANYKSIADFGAGPGTASWAAIEAFPEIDTITLFEQSAPMLAMGQKLAKGAEHLGLQQALWIQQNLQQPFALPRADLAIFSYVYHESSCLPLLIGLWKQGTDLIVIEPGTPKGFSHILAIRSTFLELGAHIAAPCPHAFSCPHFSWCHFPARVERTKIHRLLKEGSLGYEDEKYSYIAITKKPCLPIQARVVDNPIKRSGHIQLTLCTSEGKIERKTVTKKQKELYTQAKNCSWSSIITL